VIHCRRSAYLFISIYAGVKQLVTGNRKWRRPKAEQKDTRRRSDERKQYQKRLDKLVDLIVKTVQQKELCCYLEAPSEPTLLLALAAEIDRRGGFTTRSPDPKRTGYSSHEQSERALFMKAAYHRAVNNGRIILDDKSDNLLLYAYNPPKWTLHRDRQVLVDYIPTEHELREKHVEPDTEPEFIPTDRILSRIGSWL
jgi:hypothetical protein